MDTRSRRRERHKTRIAMRNAVSEYLPSVSNTGPCCANDGSNITVHSIEKALWKKHVLETTGEVTTNLLESMKTDTGRKFVSHL